MYGTAMRTYKVDSRNEQKATSNGRRMPQVSPIMPPPVPFCQHQDEDME
jgi:hypothetical protein